MTVIRTLACDQSSSCSGFAIGEREPGQKVSTLLEHGVLTPSSSCKKVESKIAEMYFDLLSLVQEYKPDWIVIEKFHWKSMKNGAAVYALASVSFACHLVAHLHGIRVQEIPPQTVKSNLDAADKETIKRRVCQIYNLQESEIKTLDHSDALGILAAFDLMKTGGIV